MKILKAYLRNLNMLFIVGAVFGYLILLDLLPRFTIAMTFFGIMSLFLTHFFRKWVKAP